MISSTTLFTLELLVNPIFHVSLASRRTMGRHFWRIRLMVQIILSAFSQCTCFQMPRLAKNRAQQGWSAALTCRHMSSMCWNLSISLAVDLQYTFGNVTARYLCLAVAPKVYRSTCRIRLHDEKIATSFYASCTI